ncbi:MAG: dihydrofolate reductase [Bacteroidota bacterium]|nr:dihydrofolate reductase [Bacteroidota bacterium]
MSISLIVATGDNNVIGLNNQLLWHLPADLKRFKSITMGHHIIMGRKTFESIGKPLPGRTNVIISGQENFNAENCIVVNTIEDALKISEHDDEIFIIGGEQIYKQTIDIADKIYLTRVYTDISGDVFFPEIDLKHWKVASCEYFEKDNKNIYNYSFFIYNKIIV